MNSEKFVNLFLEFENKYKMFMLQIKEVYIWHYIRFHVFYEILNLYGVGGILTSVKIKKNHCENSWKDFIKKTFIYNQFFAYHKDILIIPHERKFYDSRGYYRCIYTDLLDKYITNSHYILDKKSMEGEYATQNSKNVLYFDLETFKYIKKLNYGYKTVTKTELNELLFEPIEIYFNIKIDWKLRNKISSLINHYLNNREYLIKYYNYMLNKIRPQIIIMVVSYSFDRMVLCEVAKKRKIPVVELQHGMIGPMHIAYNFYEKMKLSCFPDYLFTFGPFEKDKARFPIKEDKIISVGYPELEKNCRKYNKRKSSKKVILFISQEEEKIAEYAEIIARNLDSQKYHIIFQLHPKEYFDWRRKLGEHLSDSNIEIIGDYKHTVHESLAKADWVIGNISTVLYEAQMYSTKVVVLKFGLYTNMKYLYEYGKALLVESPEQLLNEIQNNTFEPNKDVNVFETGSLKKMEININRIIKYHQINRER